MSEGGDLSQDLLRGAAAIAAFTGLSERSIYHAVAKGSLPIKRIEGLGLMARKSELAAFFSASISEPPALARQRVENPRSLR